MGIIDDIFSGGIADRQGNDRRDQTRHRKRHVVTPYCAAVKKYVYSGTSRNVINFVDTVFNVK